MSHDPRSPTAPSRRWPRGLALGLAVLFSLMLSAAHMGSVGLPGCGTSSACAGAFASVWGTLPGTGWPTAFLGSGYFLALFAGWLWAPLGLGVLRWLLRLGAAASLVLLAAMLFDTGLCPYCLVAHAAHLAFYVLEERSPRGDRTPWAPFAVTFLVASAGLGFLRAAREDAEQANQAAELEHSLGQLGTAGTSGAFTGRYLEGPATAKVRLVVISDYQCPDCRRVEDDVRVLRERYPAEVSLSAKHFPFCTDCNPEVPRNLHPNACRAALAAEAAGLVGGNEAFWRMHRWLFDHGGEFTDAELRAALADLGLEPGAFLRAMSAPTTLELVRADIEEAIRLGLHFTPMIFANGVELRGWNTPGALERAVQTVLAQAEPAAGPENDRPQDAAAKYVADWAAQPRVRLPRAGHGAVENAPLEVVVWGDYLEPTTRELDRRLRDLLPRFPEATYTFHHFPLEQDCNPLAPSTRNPGACLAARGAEAAFQLGGRAAFERMHAWLMRAPVPLDEPTLVGAATEQGLESAAFRAALNAPGPGAEVRADAGAGRRVGLRSIPLCFIGERSVPRWRLEGHDVLADILERARGH